jgi:hypothetical protein
MCATCGHLSFHRGACDFCSVPRAAWRGLDAGIRTPSLLDLTVGYEVTVTLAGASGRRVLYIAHAHTGTVVCAGQPARHALGLACRAVCELHGTVRRDSPLEFISLDMAAVLARTRQRVVLSPAGGGGTPVRVLALATRHEQPWGGVGAGAGAEAQ